MMGRVAGLGHEKWTQNNNIMKITTRAQQ